MVFNYVVYDAILGNKFLQQIVPSCKLKIYTVLKQELKEPKRISGLQDTKRGRPLRRRSPQRAAWKRTARKRAARERVARKRYPTVIVAGHVYPHPGSRWGHALACSPVIVRG